MRNKTLIILGTILGGLAIVIGIRAVAQRTSQPEAARQVIAREPAYEPSALNDRSTLSDRLIHTAQQKIKRAPSDSVGYNQLCAAFMKKARETGDFSFNTRAEAALNRSIEIKPFADNYEAIKLKAALLLTFHRFADALEIARQAQRMQPTDAENYGAMTDALVEIGDYEAALDAAQTMNDLRQDTSSYARASYLRALHGDTEGAIEAMRLAADGAKDPESIAWCRVHLGDELMNAGKLADAEHEYDIALYIFPGYHLALAAKARARLAARDTESAVEFYKQSQARVPLPEYAIALGDLYAQRGLMQEAKRQYELVEFIERAGSAESRTYSRNIALFWADHDTRLDEALAIARRERAERSDIYTSDALAWCLFKNGQLEEAKRAMDEALRLGTRDARLFYHAGMIYNGIGDRRSAGKYLKLALALNPSFDVRQAEVAKRTLRTIAI